MKLYFLSLFFVVGVTSHTAIAQMPLEAVCDTLIERELELTGLLDPAASKSEKERARKLLIPEVRGTAEILSAYVGLQLAVELSTYEISIETNDTNEEIQTKWKRFLEKAGEPLMILQWLARRYPSGVPTQGNLEKRIARASKLGATAEREIYQVIEKAKMSELGRKLMSHDQESKRALGATFSLPAFVKAQESHLSRANEFIERWDRARPKGNRH